MERVVITGMGIVSPLGCGVDLVWERLLTGKSGIRHLDESIAMHLATKVAGNVQSKDEDPEGGFSPESLIPVKDLRKMDRFIQFGLVAAEESITQAGWRPTSEHQKERTAIVIGSGIGGFPAITNAVRTTDKKGVDRLSPFTVPSFLVNMAAGHISIRYGFKGPMGSPVTACAAGVQAIGDSFRMIRMNEADVAICGGAEACIDLVSLGGFAAARALSTKFNGNPSESSRPFNQDRDGFVMGEGAGILVIEALTHALERGAKPIAEIVGYGTTSDAYHMTSGPEDGNGAKRAMEAAISIAGIQPSNIQHLNAHATSTPIGDLGEINAIKSLFSDNKSLAITSTKSSTGHLLGAAGGIEVIFTALAIRDQLVPATLNLNNPDYAGKDLRFIKNEAVKMEIEYAISNGFGFGGVNASLLLRKWHD
jgi:3-oxoacyl-[acyl-carrier-protein] synthase II